MSLLDQVWVSIELATVLQSSGPSKDAGNGVSASRPTLCKKKKKNKQKKLNIMIHSYNSWQ